MAQAKRYSGFVFDFDGTLVRLPVDWEGVRKDLRSLFRTNSEFSPLFGTLRAQISEKPHLKAAAFGLIDSYEAKGVDRCQLNDGTLDLLDYVSSKGRVCLVTMQGRPVWEAVANKFGLTKFIGDSITRAESLERSVQIRLAVERIGATPATTLFVGDRINDVVASQGTGVEVVLLGRIADAPPRPDHNFRTARELLSFLSS